MHNNSCFKEFVKYSSLNVFGMIGLSCYILADTFFVSAGLGANGLAALNLAIPFYSFVNGVGLMLGMGGGTKFSVFKSQHDTNSVNRSFTTAIMLAAIFSATFVLIGIFASDAIVCLMGADSAVYAISKTYLQVILLFSPMFILNNVLLCFVRNDGAPQMAMVAMLSGSFSNIILDYVFIFPCQMGIFGAVFATGLAPIISMMVLSVFFIKKKNCFHLQKRFLSKKLVLNIFSCGFPSLITELSSGIVIIAFNMIILRLNGNIGVAAYGVIANLSLVVLSIYTGIAQGIQPLISKSHGVANHKSIKSIMKYAIISTIALSVIIYLCVCFGAEFITGIFNTEQNLLLQGIAVKGLRIYFTACIFAGLNIIISMYFTSTCCTLPAHIISVMRGFAVIIPMAFLLSSLCGIIGVWWSFPATEIIVCCFALIMLVRGTLKQH